jgi:hypothetical protein
LISFVFIYCLFKPHPNPSPRERGFVRIFLFYLMTFSSPLLWRGFR